jgi:hypothetical protein
VKFVGKGIAGSSVPFVIGIAAKFTSKMGDVPSARSQLARSAGLISQWGDAIPVKGSYATHVKRSLMVLDDIVNYALQQLTMKKVASI